MCKRFHREKQISRVVSGWQAAINVSLADAAPRSQGREESFAQSRQRETSQIPGGITATILRLEEDTHRLLSLIVQDNATRLSEAGASNHGPEGMIEIQPSELVATRLRMYREIAEFRRYTRTIAQGPDQAQSRHTSSSRPDAFGHDAISNTRGLARSSVIETEATGVFRGVRRRRVEGDYIICMDPLADAYHVDWCKAACGQNFHRNCLATWHDVRRTCPAWSVRDSLGSLVMHMANTSLD